MVQATRGSTRVETGHMYVARTAEEFEYDADGNLPALRSFSEGGVRGGRWVYEWDGENRLVRMNTRGDVLDSGVPRQRIEFTYDSQWRRVAKRVYLWTNSTFALRTSSSFLYDGSNLVTEVIRNPQSEIRNSYVWGLDLSGSLQGAGGIGGLLAILTPDSCLLTPAYDGNGNVTALVDASTGAALAAYEYDPFGNTLRATGDRAGDNPFRFSTKYTDDETGLVYYGYRYLSPSIGRWLSRDPLCDRVPDAPFQFLSNHAVNTVDWLGLADLTIIGAPNLGWDRMYRKYTGSVRPIWQQDSIQAYIDVAQEEFDRKARSNGKKLKPCVVGIRWIMSSNSDPLSLTRLRDQLPHAAPTGGWILYMGHGVNEGGVTKTILFDYWEIPPRVTAGGGVGGQGHGRLVSFEDIFSDIRFDDGQAPSEIGVACCYAGGVPEKVGDLKLTKIVPRDKWNEEIYSPDIQPQLRKIVDHLCCRKERAGELEASP